MARALPAGLGFDWSAWRAFAEERHVISLWSQFSQSFLIVLSIYWWMPFGMSIGRRHSSRSSLSCRQVISRLAGGSGRLLFTSSSRHRQLRAPAPRLPGVMPSPYQIEKVISSSMTVGQLIEAYSPWCNATSCLSRWVPHCHDWDHSKTGSTAGSAYAVHRALSLFVINSYLIYSKGSFTYIVRYLIIALIIAAGYQICRSRNKRNTACTRLWS